MQAYIDFEIGEGNREGARELYERLLQRTRHVKVNSWLPPLPLLPLLPPRPPPRCRRRRRSTIRAGCCCRCHCGFLRKH